jgi:hypothetical protein
MRRFRIEDIDGDLLMHITLHNPPYEDADVISHTKLKQKDVKIIDVTSKYQGEE